MNGRAATVEKLIDTPAEKFYRIQPKTLIFDALRSMSIFSPSRSRRSAAPWISSVYVVDKKNCGGAWPVGKQRSTPTITQFTGRPTPGLFSVCAFKG